MTDNTHQPTEVWTWNKSAGSAFANINRPVSSPTHEKTLPVGEHSLQLYSLGTPDGQKVTIMFEELSALGVTGVEYDVRLIRIDDGDQFSSGFVKVSLNSKVPALRGHIHSPPIHVFGSGSILLYLAEKFGYFLPQDLTKRIETMSWLFWLQGAVPFLGDGFGHFYHYAPVKIEHAVNRSTMEAKCLLDVLDKQPAQHKFVTDDEHTIASIAIWSWFDNAVLGGVYDAAEFLGTGSYKYVQRWAKEVGKRPVIKRERIANRVSGPLNEQLHERHDAGDFETNTEDKRQG